MLRTLKIIIENDDTKAGKYFDLFIQGLIFLSIISFSIDTLPNLERNTKEILKVLELLVVSIFSIEYILRVLVADKKFAYIFSFYGIIDLAAILPFYVMSGVDLRTLRIFRMLRLFRILKIFRYSEAINRFYKALKSVKEEFILFSIITLMLLYMAAVGIYYFENQAQPESFKSVFHSLWWAVATLTTVGYGDIYPITIGGKLFTFCILMIGLGIVAVPTGLIASALTKTKETKE